MLSILKGDEVKGKQERVDKMNEREFGDLVELSKEITDFDVDLSAVALRLWVHT